MWSEVKCACAVGSPSSSSHSAGKISQECICDFWCSSVWSVKSFEPTWRDWHQEQCRIYYSVQMEQHAPAREDGRGSSSREHASFHQRTSEYLFELAKRCYFLFFLHCQRAELSTAHHVNSPSPPHAPPPFVWLHLFIQSQLKKNTQTTYFSNVLCQMWVCHL